jgi:DNA-binding Lrp family transcriptional regulator
MDGGSSRKLGARPQPASSDRIMRSPALDPVDRMILAQLQCNARMTNVELAQRAGISAPACLRRLRALEDAGVITGYGAHLDAEALGFGVTLFAHVGLHRQSAADLDEFSARLSPIAAVREAYLVTGDRDFLLKCVAHDVADMQTVINALTALPNVASVKTSLALGTSKFQPGVPIGADPA